MYTVKSLEDLKNDELKAICRNSGLKRYSKLNKIELVKMIMDYQNLTVINEVEKHFDILFQELSGIVDSENDYYEIKKDVEINTMNFCYENELQSLIVDGVLSVDFIKSFNDMVLCESYDRYLKIINRDIATSEIATSEIDTSETTSDIATIETIDTSKLSFNYTEKEKVNTIDFISELVKLTDKDEVELFCENYVNDKRETNGISVIKKYFADIRHCLKESNVYIAELVNEDLVNDDLIHIAYNFVKLPIEDYEKQQKQDEVNVIEKIDNKVELTDNVIAEYLTKSEKYLTQRDNYKLVVIAICALTARRFIEVFRLITDYDVNEKYTLTISTNQLAKNKRDENEVLDTYCLVDSEKIATALDWLRNESELKEILEECKDLSNEEFHNKYNNKINKCVKKHYSEFLPYPSNNQSLSIHNLRAVSSCLMVHFFTKEYNDVDLFLSKCLGHSGGDAKKYYKSYYVPSTSKYYRGYLLNEDNQEKTIVFNDYQLNLIQELGGIDEVLRLAKIATTIKNDDTIATDKTTAKNTDKTTIEDEFQGYKQYYRIKECIDRIKEFNNIATSDEDKIMLTSTAIYQITGVRTDTISNFRNETDYGDFDSYNNQFNFSYRQNSGKNLKELLGY